MAITSAKPWLIKKMAITTAKLVNNNGNNICKQKQNKQVLIKLQDNPTL